MASRKKQSSSSMERTSDWIFSQEFPSDLQVQAGGVVFTLHKFPLVSKSGYIRKQLTKSTDPDTSFIEIPDIPGGAEAFELAAKFCYGVNFEINAENIGDLCSVSEFLEMTEDYASDNLLRRTEKYLEEVILKNLSASISVLHESEYLIPFSMKTKFVLKCVEAIAYNAYQESQLCFQENSGKQRETLSFLMHESKDIVEWWMEDITVLRIDLFHQVLIAMKERGFKDQALGPVLMLYAQKCFRGLEIFEPGKKKIDLKLEYEKRVVLETIVSHLPEERNSMSVSFLSMLLRSAIYLDTTFSCRLNLENKMGLQLDQAVLDDLLILSFNGDTLFDVETVRRILVNYIENEVGEQEKNGASMIGLEGVAMLMDSYVAEIAADHKLTVSMFMSIAELIPEQARVTDDGMYRAIDIFLKTHPSLSEIEKKKICSLMDCQKLSREACAHAAQNDRLPIQVVVQVLFYEQKRLKKTMNGNTGSPFPYGKMTPYSPISRAQPDEVSRLRRENEDLKLELVQMKLRMKEIENGVNMNVSDKSSLHRKSIMNSISRKLGKFYPFARVDSVENSDVKVPVKAKLRRYSMS